MSARQTVGSAANNSAIDIPAGANTVSVISVSSGTVTGTITVGSNPVSVAFSPAPLVAAIGDSAGNALLG